MQAKAVAISEASIHFGAQSEVLAAEGAGFGGGSGGQGAAAAYGVTELPGAAGKILFSDEVFGDVPAFEVAGEDQFEFDLALLVVAVVTTQEIGAAVVPHDVQQSFVGSVDIGEFNG